MNTRLLTIILVQAILSINKQPQQMFMEPRMWTKSWFRPTKSLDLLLGELGNVWVYTNTKQYKRPWAGYQMEKNRY